MGQAHVEGLGGMTEPDSAHWILGMLKRGLLTFQAGAQACVGGGEPIFRTVAVTSSFVFSLSRGPRLLVRQQRCPAMPPTLPRAQRRGQDGCSLAPALDLAARSQVASEMSWAPDLSGWDYLYL